MIMHILRSKKVAKRILLALLILIIPAFVLWGAGTLTSGPGTIGRIGGKTITDRSLDKSRQAIKAQLLFSYYGDFNTLNKITQDRQLLNFMAWERLVLLDGANRAKITVPDTAIVQFIAQHPLFRRGGGFDSTTYSYILKNTLGMDPRQFEEFTRENLKTHLFRQSITQDMTVSDKEVLEFYGKDHDKVVLSYLLLPKESFSEEVEVTETDIREYYENNKELFLDPAKMTIEYMSFPYDYPNNLH